MTVHLRPLTLYFYYRKPPQACSDELLLPHANSYSCRQTTATPFRFILRGWFQHSVITFSNSWASQQHSHPRQLFHQPHSRFELSEEISSCSFFEMTLSHVRHALKLQCLVELLYFWTRTTWSGIHLCLISCTITMVAKIEL
jgi:hypothetical protein